MRSPVPGHHRGAPIPATVHRTAQAAPAAVDTSRPFGAHLRMSWWKPLVLVLTVPLVLVVLQVLAYQLVGIIEAGADPLSPESTGWTTVAVSATTIAFLTVTLLTTPIQAAGEELIHRSVMLPAAASWVRPVRPALAVGLVVSAPGFAAVHGSTDPWLAGYFVVVAVSTGLMALLSGGTEAPIAFHVVNNVLFGMISNVMSGGGTTTIDRATATGDASLLVLVAANAGMVALVATYERRRRRDTGEAPAHRPEGTP